MLRTSIPSAPNNPRCDDRHARSLSYYPIYDAGSVFAGTVGASKQIDCAIAPGVGCALTMTRARIEQTTVVLPVPQTYSMPFLRSAFFCSFKIASPPLPSSPSSNNHRPSRSPPNLNLRNREVFAELAEWGAEIVYHNYQIISLAALIMHDELSLIAAAWTHISSCLSAKHTFNQRRNREGARGVDAINRCSHSDIAPICSGVGMDDSRGTHGWAAH
ncbi:hypothetical protein EVG20_g10742 [Dentipellis fragilis]|uniref:Uncharacterized protein n=1 Tax=Dentipellis fragilis TaxID=205917 RepID=A0A4Y9XPF7_9AGAM|nr:hypothetical protein EVG20_g10742 [Dentipellis fragilis]